MLKDTVFCFISICCLHVQALTGFEVLSATVVGFFFFLLVLNLTCLPLVRRCLKSLLAEINTYAFSLLSLSRRLSRF